MHSCFNKSINGTSTDNERTRPTVPTVAGISFDSVATNWEGFISARWIKDGDCFFSFFPFSHRVSAPPPFLSHSLFLFQQDVAHLRRHYTAWQGASVPAPQLLATFSAPYSRTISSHASGRVTPMGRQQPRRTMIVADDALYTKRRPSDLPYASPLLESIDEPLRIERIETWLRIVGKILEMLMPSTFQSLYFYIWSSSKVGYAIIWTDKIEFECSNFNKIKSFFNGKIILDIFFKKHLFRSISQFISFLHL